MSFRQPRPQTAGYVFILAVGTAVSIVGGFLGPTLSVWWLDKLAHAAGGFTLALGLLILFPRTQTAVMVVVLSLVWELIEWTIGLPLVVSVVDTQIDLLAGWLGLAIALLGTTLVTDRRWFDS